MLRFRLLKTAAHFDKPLKENQPNILQKRHIYVRSYVKLTSVLATKHKALLSTKEAAFVGTIHSFLTHIESVVESEEELNAILAEVLGLLNISGISKPAAKAFEQWLAVKATDSMVLKAVMKNLAINVIDNEIVAVLLEVAVNSYFFNGKLNLSLIFAKVVLLAHGIFPTKLKQTLR